MIWSGYIFIIFLYFFSSPKPKYVRRSLELCWNILEGSIITLTAFWNCLCFKRCCLHSQLTRFRNQSTEICVALGFDSQTLDWFVCLIRAKERAHRLSIDETLLAPVLSTDAPDCFAYVKRNSWRTSEDSFSHLHRSVIHWSSLPPASVSDLSTARWMQLPRGFSLLISVFSRIQCL